MIGNRLKLCRAAAGLSLRDLEAKIGNRVTAQAIGKYERNQSMPSSDVVIALADALDTSVDYLLSKDKTVIVSLDFRKNGLVSKREEAHVKAKVLHLLDRYLAVEELLHLPSMAWDKPREAPWPVLEHLAETEHAANGLRDHWGLGRDPIPNLVELLEVRGIKVLSIDLQKIDGLAVRARSENGKFSSVVVVNKQNWGERQRFTIAHELGHMVLEAAQKVDGEKAAHRFAGAFLMPAKLLRAEIGRHRKSIGWKEFFALKAMFGVSVQALTYRCRDLGIINMSMFQQLFKEFDHLGWRTPPYQEPYSLSGEEPKRFERLCFRALAEGAISDSKAAELLGTSVREIVSELEEPPRISV